jgi:hypothetical protein
MQPARRIGERDDQQQPVGPSAGETLALPAHLEQFLDWSCGFDPFAGGFQQPLDLWVRLKCRLLSST